MIPALILAASLTISVVDGDTIRVDEEYLRIENIDTPETWRPECLAERMLGEKAKERLEKLVALVLISTTQAAESMGSE